MKIHVFLRIMLMFLFSASAMASTGSNGEESNNIYSAVRGINEPYQTALKRQFGEFPKGSAGDLAVPVKDIDYDHAGIPTVGSYEEVVKTFKIIRDTPFLIGISTSLSPDLTPRRISWLYPKDFCYARAATAGMLADQKHLVRPYKILAFGDLAVNTPFIVGGTASWYYHIAEILGVKKSSSSKAEYYVLDPAIDSSHPLPVNQWFNIMNSKNYEDMKGVVCNQYTFGPGSSCHAATELDDYLAFMVIQLSLKVEKENLSILDYDWTKLLRNNPPWELSSYGDCKDMKQCVMPLVYSNPVAESR